VHTTRANLDLVTILIGEGHALGGDTRFAEFVDDAATRLGRLIDAAAGGQSKGQGYLTARAYFGALIAFVLLQDQLGLASIRPVDATEYVHHLAQQRRRLDHGSPSQGTDRCRDLVSVRRGAVGSKGVPWAVLEPRAQEVMAELTIADASRLPDARPLLRSR
jgi:hypothetical protein